MPNRRSVLGIAAGAAGIAAISGTSFAVHREESRATGKPVAKPTAKPVVKPAAVAAPAGSGAYVGSSDPSALAAFGTWRSRPVDFAIDYLDRRSWSDIERPSWWLQSWSKARTRLVLGVPMLTDDGSTNLQAGARGEYDHSFVALARAMVSYGQESAFLRIGWEMNGDWYRWSAGSDPAAWRAYYRRIVSAMRSVAGQKFRLTWSINLGASNMPAELAYPGNDIVDHIGVDAYDDDWGAGNATATDRWQYLLKQDHGLNWAVAFAKAHGKRLAIPEWGLDVAQTDNRGGGGDDPYYIQQMLAWATANKVLYEAYYNSGVGMLSQGAFPNAASRYRQLVKTAA